MNVNRKSTLLNINKISLSSMKQRFQNPMGSRLEASSSQTVIRLLNYSQNIESSNN
jgi:hypothetical protein